MDENCLKMNESKMEFITFAARKQLPKCEIAEITVHNCVIERANVICYLGVWLDQHLNLKKQITTKCATAVFNIQCIKHIWNTLTQSACQTLAQGLVMARLNYANASYFGLPDIDVKRLQRVQNIAARLILGKTNQDSITECLRELHWLPIRAQIDFKTLVLVYKCLWGNAPKYLKNLITLNPVNRPGLRSKRKIDQLIIPFTKYKTFAARYFAVAGPTLWNCIPQDIKLSNSIEKFKSSLKTHLYNKYLNQNNHF